MGMAVLIWFGPMLLWSLFTLFLILNDRETDDIAVESVYPFTELAFDYVEDAIWLNDNELLLTIRENTGIESEYTIDVVIYDWHAKQTVLSFKKSLNASNFDRTCISENGLLLDAKLNVDGQVKYHDLFFNDVHNPMHYLEYDFSFDESASHYWLKDQIDCRPYKAQKNAPKENLDENGQIVRDYSSQSIRISSHGRTKTIIDPQNNIIIKGLASNTDQLDNSAFAIPSDLSGRDLKSQWLRADDSYFLYQQLSDLSQNPSKFKSTAWKLSKNLNPIKQYDLPAGPWIYNRGYRSCFSCGCECYDRMNLRLSNETIFAKVTGSGVRQKHKGIYRLQEDQTWEHILIGEDTRSFSISENSCLIATGGENPKVINICSPKL